MCKEVGAYPKCSQCANFVTPDATPGVMTWPELLEHMDNLVAWGQGELKSWRKAAAGSALQLKHIPLSAVEQRASVPEQACWCMRRHVQGGRCLPQVQPVCKLCYTRLNTWSHDLARIVGAHGQSGCLGAGRTENMALHGSWLSAAVAACSSCRCCTENRCQRAGLHV